MWGSHQTLWSTPLQNCTWHSGTWSHTMTPSIDKKKSLIRDLVIELDLINAFGVITLFLEVSIGHLQRVQLANRWRLLLRTPCPVPFGTCICSNVETIHSWTCHVLGPFEFRTFLGTSISLTYNRCMDNLHCEYATILTWKRELDRPKKFPFGLEIKTQLAQYWSSFILVNISAYWSRKSP